MSHSFRRRYYESLFGALLLATAVSGATPLLPRAAAASDAEAPPAQTPSPASVPLAPPKEKEKADIPAIRYDKEGKPMAMFQQRHEAFLARAKEGPIGLLFIGDSITAGWAKSADIWQKYYGAYHPANFGI
ncbi:MAG TPA: hypothetical protein VK970_26490, partial [Candidatus Methylacidiphilales bacterium]|nr:hypothetical protein [Candidatus Methylacidiphilales bacterium]